MTLALPTLSDLIGNRPHPAMAVVVTPERTHVELRAAEPHSDFEIGSITKALTALLYVDALERAEVEADAPVGRYLPLGDGPIAQVPLAAITTHRSGLPRSEDGLRPWRASWEMLRRGTNPYGQSREVMLERASMTALKSDRFRYSNLGFQLLGHAVASAAGMPYARLIDERLFTPLGMAHATVPSTPQDLRPHAIVGTGRRGGLREPWVGEGLGPAGTGRVSADDALALLSALLTGTAVGMGALEPVAQAGPLGSIGAAWFTSPFGPNKSPITWHNGATGGFRSFLGLSRETGHGALIIHAHARKVDRAGVRLIRAAVEADA